jgi:hypothetical protein
MTALASTLDRGAVKQLEEYLTVSANGSKISPLTASKILVK